MIFNTNFKHEPSGGLRFYPMAETVARSSM